MNNNDVLRSKIILVDLMEIWSLC